MVIIYFYYSYFKLQWICFKNEKEEKIFLYHIQNLNILARMHIKILRKFSSIYSNFLKDKADKRTMEDFQFLRTVILIQLQYTTLLSLSLSLFMCVLLYNTFDLILELRKDLKSLVFFSDHLPVGPSLTGRLWSSLFLKFQCYRAQHWEKRIMFIDTSVYRKAEPRIIGKQILLRAMDGGRKS